KEQSLQLRQLRVSPIETAEGGVRVLDEVGRDDRFWPGVERSSAEQQPECCKIRSAVLLGTGKLHRDVDETADQLRLRCVWDSLWQSGEPNEFGGRFGTANPVQLPGQKFVLAFIREPTRHPAP